MNFEKIVIGLVIVNIALIGIILYIFIKLDSLSQIISQVKEIATQQIIPEVTNSPKKNDSIAVSEFKPVQTKGEMIIIGNDGFNTKGIQAYSGQKLELTIVNDSTNLHSFNIDELNVKTGPIEPGKTFAITIDNLPLFSVAYEYYSNIANDKESGNFNGTIMILKK